MGDIEECLLCNTSEFSRLYEESSFNYGICCNCGHVQQVHKHSFDYYDKLPYESQWNDYENHCKDRASYISEFCSSSILNSKSILDIGSGPGGVLKELKNIVGDGCIYTGVTSIQDKNKVVEGLDFKFGDFHQMNMGGVYDFVILCHVLEHSLNPKQMIKKIYDSLKENGNLYIEVPSFHWVEIRSNPMFCGVHISYFSKNQLVSLLKIQGFKIKKIKDSKYWGNIKILAEKTSTLPKQKFNHFENYLLKIFTWSFRKYFLYYIIKLYKLVIKIKPND